MKLSIIFLCFLGAFGLIDAFKARSFFNGRRVGSGMLKLDSIAKKECKVCRTTTDYFEQKLDHFEPSDTRTWQQLYFTNDEFYDAEAGGPVFLFIGGEGPASDGWMTTGQWVNNGQKYGALLFQLEHRYYGESHPTEDLSIENIKYLSSEQALADLASFIVAKNAEYGFGPDVKWIVYGGSYAGNLAAWFRAKYPHLAHAAVASSAPVRAEVDYQEYYAVVYESLKVHSAECVVAIKDAVDATDALVQAADYEQLNEIFEFCEPLTADTATVNNIATFYDALAETFAGIVQYNDDNVNPGTSGIDSICADMLDESIGTPIQRLAATTSGCVDYDYGATITFLSDSSYEAAGGSRQWYYQTCTEFGYYQTSNQSNMFTNQFPVEYFVNLCKDAFDVSFDADFLNRAIDDTNTEYGALDIEVSRTVFVHGTIDPWHALGITETRDPNALAILIESGSHCMDMYSTSADDLPQLVAAREQISELVGSWLEA